MWGEELEKWEIVVGFLRSTVQNAYFFPTSVEYVISEQVLCVVSCD